MNKYQKNQLDALIDILKQAHESIEKMIRSGDKQSAAMVLENCQNAAISMGQTIDEVEGEGTNTVKRLEEYCELVYSLHEELFSDANIMAATVVTKLDKSHRKILTAYNSEIHALKLAVFLPYKASMWDSLESVWRQYDADPEWEAVVMPIPYFDRNPDGSFKEYHYEGLLYPEDVPIIYYKDFNLEEQHPDVIYIHNPYDGTNFVTSVHPDYYSAELKKYTDKLVYIPYFVLSEPNPNDKKSIEGMAHFARTSAAYNVDEIIVQSENMRLCYIEALVQKTGEHTRESWSRKIKGTGSPKFERIANTDKSTLSIPQEWKDKIYRADGSAKKVILYNTSVGALLRESELMIDKISDVLSFFRKNHDDVALLWRPHPLMEATLSSMRPDLWDAYNAIVTKYKEDNFGIYDDTADLDRAIALSDAYYGDVSSVVQLCQSVKKPIMIQNVRVKQQAE